MADRFPSLEGFESGVISPHTSTQDFLAREKALLGDDANQFATSDDTNAFTNPSDDLLGKGNNTESTFESQFPDLANSSFGTGVPGGNVMTGPVSYNPGFQSCGADEEPDIIKEWRERRDEQNFNRTQNLAAQREGTIKEAQQNIDDFYENYNSKKEKGIAQTRKEAEEFLSSRDDTLSGGTSWDRIAKLVNVSGKGDRGGAAGSGKERFREMLMSLGKDEKAPGATGY